MLKGPTILFCLSDESSFSNIWILVNMWQWIELNWLRKHMKKVRNSQASISIDSCSELSKTRFFPARIVKWNHSHKKRKDSLEGSLDRVLFAAELKFPTILVPRLPQHTSDLKTECAGKTKWSKQLYSLYLTSF